MSESVMAAAARVDALGGSVFPLVDRAPRPHVVAAQEAVEDAAVKEASRQNALWTLTAYARTAVALAAELGGQDPRHSRPADAMAADNITRILISVMGAAMADLPSAFRQGSAGADMAKAEAVAKAIAGEG